MNLEERWKQIVLIVYDFDGVMTDNRVMVDQNGIESVMVHRGDGYGIAQLKKMGYRQVIISTETNEVVKRRAEKLKLEIIHGVHDKKTILEEFCKENGISLEQVLFLGNDLNDYEAMLIAGLRGAPADAEEEILAIAHWISKVNGGYGVIRELYRYLGSMMTTTGKETCHA